MVILISSYNITIKQCKINLLAGELTVRLVNGKRWFGLLEVLYDGVWSTVCSRGFGHQDVLVVCKILKYQRFVLNFKTLQLFFSIFILRSTVKVLFSKIFCKKDLA